MRIVLTSRIVHNRGWHIDRTRWSIGICGPLGDGRRCRVNDILQVFGILIVDSACWTYRLKRNMQRDGTTFVIVHVAGIQAQIGQLYRAEEQRIVAVHLGATRLTAHAEEVIVAPPADMGRGLTTSWATDQRRSVQLHDLGGVLIAIDVGGHISRLYQHQHVTKNMQIVKSKQHAQLRKEKSVSSNANTKSSNNI